MRIGKVEYRNFGPFESATVDFDRPGLTVIEGVMRGRTGASSNGSGKSFLLDGVAWALFGRCLRERYAGDDVVRHGADGARVDVVLKTPSGDVVVSRTRGGRGGNTTRVLVGGKDVSRGTAAETDAMLVQSVVGMDYIGFCNTTAFGAREDVRGFFSATDSQRKELLDSLLGLDVWVRAEGAAIEERNKVRERKTLLAASVLRCREAVGLARQAVQQAEESVETLRASGTDLLEETARKAEKAVARATADEKEARDAMQRCVQDEQESVCRYEEAAKRFQREQARLSEIYARLRGERDVARANVESVRSRLKAAESMGAVCDKCGQPIRGEHRESSVAALRRELKLATEAEHRAEAALKAAEAERDALRPPARPVSNVQAYLQRVNAAQAERVRAERVRAEAADALRTAQARLDAAVGRLEAARRELESRLDMLGEAERDEAAATSALAVADFWVAGFGAKGVRSHIIESAMAGINEDATRYVQRLAGAGAYVQLRPTTDLKTRSGAAERISVAAHIPNCTDTYYGASKGQKKRFDIALLLALRDYVVRRTPACLDQLFLDEAFDGLDRAGCEAVVDLLSDMSKQIPVVLVTHDDALRSAGDRTIRVIHDGTTAKVVA